MSLVTWDDGRPRFKSQIVTRKQSKSRKDRTEAAVKKAVRAECAERDGACRIGDWEMNPDDIHDDDLESDPCDGRSEWAHLGEKKRFKTRGQAPEVRHTTAGSLMLCRHHHGRYDAGKLTITGASADGVLEFWMKE